MSFRGQIQPTTEVLGDLCWQAGIQQVLVQDVSRQVLSQPTSLPCPPWSTSYNRVARKPLTPATDTCWLWAEEHPSTCSESDANAQLLWEINLFPVFKICGFTILLIQPQGAVNTRCFWNWGWGRRGTKTQGAENPASASVKGNIESVWSAFQRLLCVIFFFLTFSL